MTAIIESSRLSRRFGKNWAVRDLSLTVPAGSVFALLGPNGAGKTTTIKMVMGLVRPSSGQALVLGKESIRLGPKEYARIGYVSENQKLPEWMTVQDLIDFCGPMYPSWDRALCSQLIRRFELPLGSKLKDCSRGTRIKTLLLTSLAYRPELVVLDEPFSGLDTLVREEFIRGLLELSDMHEWTLLISSHDIDEVEQLVDRVGLIDNGELRLAESTSSLRNRYRRLELTLGPGEEAPKPIPASWLLYESMGRVVRFVDSDFDLDSTKQRIQQIVPGAGEIAVAPMSLRSIYSTLAQTWRSEAKEQP